MRMLSSAVALLASALRTTTTAKSSPLLHIRSAHRKRKKVVTVWNMKGQPMHVDIRDAGKKKYSRTPPDPSASPMPGGPNLRGRKDDQPEVRLSKTISWLLRHGAQGQGLAMRPDGYVRVKDLMDHRMLVNLDLLTLENLVKNDQKKRYTMIQEPDTQAGSAAGPIWWIRANQGHSIKSVELDLTPITSPTDVPMAVHGTTLRSWKFIAEQGLSKMRRNHIHLAQGVPGNGVISGMRTSSQILIYVDIAKALSVGIKFYLSSNGVVLTEGDELGFLSPSFFERVVDARGKLVTGWEGAKRDVDPTSDLLEVSAVAEAKEPESAIAKELEGMSLKS